MALASGYFPLEIVSDGSPHLFRKDSKGKWQYVSQSLGFVQADFEHCMLRHDPLSTAGYSSSRPGAFSVYYDGRPNEPEIPDLIIKGQDIRNSTPKFKQLQAKGEMLVSNFESSSIHLSYRNGTIGDDGGTHTQIVKILYQLKTYYGYKTDNFRVYSKDGNEYVQFESDPVKRVVLRTNIRSVNPYSVFWSDSFASAASDKLYNASDRLLQLMWTNVLSDANQATVDILTSMAELPKTLESIVDLIRSIFSAFKAVKNKELRLMNKSKRVRAEYQARIDKNNYQSHLEYLKARNHRSRKIIEAQRLARNKQLASDMKLQLEEITSSVSQVWLNFRYNITPNAILIKDAAEVYMKGDRIFNRWSDRDQSTVTSDDIQLAGGWSAAGELLSVHRAFIKRRFDADRSLAKYLKELSLDLLSTAWELIPLSFVVDWFVNIGNYIRALFGSNPVNYEEVSTFSSQVPGSTMVFIHKDSGAQVHATYKGYKRSIVPRPTDYCSLLFEPYISVQRSYDALALSWSLFGKKFSKHSPTTG